jgi:hypothetical protein
VLGAATGTTVSSSGSAALIVVLGILLAFVVLQVAALWRIFTKAGEPGWTSLIPVYNAYVLLKIAGRPGWWLLLYFVPFVNVVIAIIAVHELSKSFGHGGEFTLGLLFLPLLFYPLLGFGSDRYLGPGGVVAGLGYPQQFAPPPPGWYPDPSDPSNAVVKRWWDGRQWTQATSDQHWHGPGA